jgi:hypothetical protein
MFKEYYVVARYVAAIPKGKDMTEFILAEVEKEISDVSPRGMKDYLSGLFSVIEGEEVDMDNEDEE